MHIIVGLGNPGSRYEGTRHNVGFEVIDRLAEQYHISVDNKKCKGLIGKGMIGSEPVLLVRPMTFMNLSGECVREVMSYYKVGVDGLIVVFDDVSLPPGQLRIRAKGSAGGHNGMKNIILHCGSQEFARVRVGIGEKHPHEDLADYVLSHFHGADKVIMREAYDRAAEAIGVLLRDGVEKAMNQYN